MKKRVSVDGGVCAVGIDLGGSKIGAGLIDGSGRVVRRMERPTHPGRGPEAVLADVREMSCDLADGAPVAPLGVGIAIPGAVDPERRVSVLSPNLGWHEVSLDLDLPDLAVTVDHDVRAAAWGEVCFGAARGARNLLHVVAGTGIGAAMVLDGRRYLGAHGFPGEIGHLVFEPGGPPCGCGNLGCVEALSSGRAVASRLSRVGTDPKSFFGQPRYEPDEVALIDELVRPLAVGLAAAVNLLDPDLVTVSGGLVRAGDAWLKPLGAAIAERLMPPHRERLRIVPAALGDDAGIIGAAAMVPGLLDVRAR